MNYWTVAQINRTNIIISHACLLPLEVDISGEAVICKQFPPSWYDITKNRSRH